MGHKSRPDPYDSSARLDNRGGPWLFIGGELVLAFDDAGKMLKAAESLGSPVSASHWVRKDGRTPFAIYVAPKAE